MNRTIPFAISCAIASLLAGCNDAVAPPAAPTTTKPAAPAPPSPSIEMQPLTAAQLAEILNVNAWTAKYSGGPIEVWLEIEEAGQSTMPKRIPEKDFLGSGAINPPSEGTITFWWTRREDRLGGVLSINPGNGGYTYGLGKDSFTFAWQGFSARVKKIEKDDLVPGAPGKEFVIVDYDASEMANNGDDKKPPRRLHLMLKGRFAAPK